MNTAKVKILKSIKSIKTGYGLTGSARTMVQQVYDWVTAKPKKEQDGWIDLFDVLCTTEPSRVTGGGWEGGMMDLAKEVSDVDVKPPEGGMTLAEMQAMHKETAAKASEPKAPEVDENAAKHAAIIASAGVEVAQTAEEVEAEEAQDEADATAEVHAAVIASAPDPEDAARKMLSGE